MTFFPLASRMEAVQSPVIPQIGQFIRQNPGTISLGQGIVFYPPPATVLASLTDCLADVTNHQYQAVQGIPPLLTAITQKLATDNHITIEPGKNAVVVTAGANMGFLNAVLAITQVGDEIIVNTPYYFNHEMAIRIAGCQPITVPTDEHYQLQLDQIQAAITPKTRAIVTISPNNPTGIVYPSQVLTQINQLCRERGLYHITDEAYEYFTYGGHTHFSPGSLPHSAGHTISLFSLSKSYGFAGWRVGYMVIPTALLLAVKKIQDTNLICPPIVCQYAAIAALTAGQDYCQQFLPEIAQNRQAFLAQLQPLADQVTWVIPQGAFYGFLRLPEKHQDLALVQQLIERYQVAVLPGSTFGMVDGCYLRVAYGALRFSLFQEGLQRLINGLGNLL
ncbi:MAG: pyridoxal phosphate-dependent aminotransferase [Microcystaceae cyanobacterium]